jgi:hypothetical protein
LKCNQKAEVILGSKHIFLVIIINLFLHPGNAKAQNKDSTRYGDFLTFVRRGFNPSDTVKKNCEWQYALVKVLTNENNRIVSYTLLNRASDDLKKSFSFLIGYQFSNKLLINKHPVVFCISIDSEKSSCILSRKQYSATEVLGKFFSDLEPIFESDPKTIFIPRITMISYSSDSIR